MEGQIQRMQKLHNDIKRLSNDVTNGIDDISRFISMQYMKKKTNEIKQKRDQLTSLGGTTVNPASITAVRNLGLKAGAEDARRNADLFNSHPAIHGYGKIEQSEKNFENLGKQNGERGNPGERSNNQNYQPL